MDVHDITQLSYGGITTHQSTDLLYNVGRMGTKGMTAQQATIGSVDKEF